MQGRIMSRISNVLVLVLALIAGACSKDSPGSSGSSAAPGSPGSQAAPGGYLKVDAYCSAFCGKLCGTCGNADCPGACKPRCYHGRAPDLAMDGKDPTVALALTQKELDGCLATITPESCPALMSGQVPAACFTIKH